MVLQPCKPQCTGEVFTLYDSLDSVSRPDTALARDALLQCDFAALQKAAQTALDYTHESIRLTLQGGGPLRYSVRFGLVFPQLMEALKQKRVQ